MGGDPGDDEDIVRYYGLGLERGRLDEAYFPLERARTRELIARHLDPGPGVVLDVGGAAGDYALWLASRGFSVHLVDPVPLHVEQARAAERELAGVRLASVSQGDARRLGFDDEIADAVLMLGPLYHLITAEDRRTALGEARRVLRPGGRLFAAAISRFASMIDGLRGPVFDDETFARIVDRDLEDGQHRNETGKPEYFTTAYFHHPEELEREVRSAGFAVDGVFAVEGPGAGVAEFKGRWDDPRAREKLLALVRRVEREPSLLGASPHLLVAARRADTGGSGRRGVPESGPTRED